MVLYSNKYRPINSWYIHTHTRAHKHTELEPNSILLALIQQAHNISLVMYGNCSSLLSGSGVEVHGYRAVGPVWHMLYVLVQGLSRTLGVSSLTVSDHVVVLANLVERHAAAYQRAQGLERGLVRQEIWKIFTHFTISIVARVIQVYIIK